MLNINRVCLDKIIENLRLSTDIDMGLVLYNRTYVFMISISFNIDIISDLFYETRP